MSAAAPDPAPAMATDEALRAVPRDRAPEGLLDEYELGLLRREVEAERLRTELSVLRLVQRHAEAERSASVAELAPALAALVLRKP